MISIVVESASVKVKGITDGLHAHADECETNDFRVIFKGSSRFRAELRTAFAADDALKSVSPEEPGWWVHIDKHHYRVVARGDLLGAFPLYWAVEKNNLHFFDRMAGAGVGLAYVPDETGVIQFIRNGYCVGNRTLFKRLYRLRPGESLEWTPGGSPRLSDESTLWTSWDTRDPSVIVDEASERWLEACHSLDNAVLMFSGGWDSRTLLAGALNQKCEVTLYTHGDIGSREAQIARRIGVDHSIDQRMREIDASMFEPDFIARSAQRYENVVFPHWHAASEFIGDRPVCAGIYGAVFGGHNGPVMFAQGWKKPIALLRTLYGKDETFHQQADGLEQARAVLSGPTKYQEPWYVSSERWLAGYRDVAESSNEDVAREIDRYRNRGIASSVALIEAFATEHRGTQYMLAQLHSAAASGDFVNPFANASIVRLACRIPYSLKVHNILNKRVISRIFPELLRYPLAATLCKASRPLLVQEMSRLVRKTIEEGHWWLSSKTHGAIAQPHFGWVDFKFMADGGVLDGLVDSLNYDLFDKVKMRALCGQIVAMNRSLHPLMDMLMKIKTVDGILSFKAEST